jgi:hypothetical protein
MNVQYATNNAKQKLNANINYVIFVIKKYKIWINNALFVDNN